LLVGVQVWNGTERQACWRRAVFVFRHPLCYNYLQKPQVAGVIPMMQQTALKYDVEVKENGHVELSVPFPAGAHLIVFVIQADDTFDDLLMAAESSLDFWDNPWDDEDWNNA
jgi:hypothetical protein